MRAGSDTTDIQPLASLNQQCPPGATSAAGSEDSSSQGGGVNIAAIAGGVVGACVFLGLIAALVCGVLMLRRRRSRALAEKGLPMGAYRNASLDGKVSEAAPNVAPSADSMCHTTFASVFLQLCLGMYRSASLVCNAFICSLLSSSTPTMYECRLKH